MRLDRLSFIALLALSAACTTDDTGLGKNRGNADTSEAGDEQAQGPKDNERPDAKVTPPAPPAKDGAISSGEADAAGPTRDAAQSAEDASPAAVDASQPAPDAAQPGTDAGEVDPTPDSKRCGTRGGVQCKDNEFCDFAGDEQCGATDKGGVCKPIMKGCTKEYAPVCGCDDRTYGNACSANAEGVSVKREGLCSPAECEAAGGTPKYSLGAGTPKCPAGSESWALSGGIEPVVCCLGKVAVDPGICGGLAGFKCPKGQYCNYEPPYGQGCGQVADGAGTCQAVPGGACITLYKPVCGCDGKTYSNDCVAHSSGVSIKSQGACE